MGDGDLACWAGLVCFECGAIVKGGYHRPGCRRGEGRNRGVREVDHWPYDSVVSLTLAYRT